MKTIDDVLDFIRTNSNPGDWKLTSSRDIRHVATETCPVCWAWWVKSGLQELLIPVYYPEAGRCLGLDHETVVDPIAAAADNCRETLSGMVNKELRNRLLEACHLQENQS